jgi:hypothetical protein
MGLVFISASVRDGLGWIHWLLLNKKHHWVVVEHRHRKLNQGFSNELSQKNQSNDVISM